MPPCATPVRQDTRGWVFTFEISHHPQKWIGLTPCILLHRVSLRILRWNKVDILCDAPCVLSHWALQRIWSRNKAAMLCETRNKGVRSIHFWDIPSHPKLNGSHPLVSCFTWYHTRECRRGYQAKETMYQKKIYLEYKWTNNLIFIFYINWSVLTKEENVMWLEVGMGWAGPKKSGLS